MLLRAVIAGVVGGALTGWIGWSSFIPDPIAFHSVALTMIGAIYLGFALSDGRLSIMILEGLAGTAVIVLALLGLWWAPGIVAVGLILHAFWDLAHRPRLVTTKVPRWYPPFCAAYDLVFAGVFLVLARDLAGRGA
jgi:hypothetical protein